jgi:hypothetical protein
MASAELSRRVEKVVGYPPLSEMGELQRREFHEALLDADAFEDLPGKWQAAILEAEQNRPCGFGRVRAWAHAATELGALVGGVVRCCLGLPPGKQPSAELRVQKFCYT